MASIHFIGGEKGGVGKSVLARVVAQTCIDQQIPFLGFDSDRSHGSFRRFYSDFAAPVVIDRFESLDNVIAPLLEDPPRQVIVDLAAQTLAPLQTWFAASGLAEVLAASGHRIVLWHVMDDSHDAVLTLDLALKQFGAAVTWVVVLNEGRGNDFAGVRTSAAGIEADRLGATWITMPKLYPSTMHLIDQHSTSFWAAIHRSDKDPATLGLLDRQRVKVWLNRLTSQVLPILRP
ncbi:hypothetical protein LBMAG53_15950 [Planctomycetota bacterium]|nr:hypothetical protein LBMAG53_15950 [Planctomycetota bacterium]